MSVQLPADKTLFWIVVEFMLKAFGYILLTLILLGAVSFAAAPTLMAWAVPRYLQSEGISSAFQFGRPGLSGITVHSARVDTATMQVRASNVLVGYSLASIGKGRLTDVHIDTLHIAIEPGGDTNSNMAIPSPWVLLPMDRLRVDALQIENHEPTVTLTGELDLNVTQARANLLIESPLLPTNLDASLWLDPVGGIDITLAQSGAPVALQLTGVPDGDTIFIDGMIGLADETFELLARLALPGDLTGQLRGKLSATLPWPVAMPLDLQQVRANGEFDLDVSGRLPSIEAMMLNGQMTASLASGQLEFGAESLNVRAGSVVVDDITYQVDEESGLDVAFNGGIPIDAMGSGLLNALDVDIRTGIDLGLSSDSQGAIARSSRVSGQLTTSLAKGDGVTSVDEGTALDLMLADYELGLVADAPFEVRWDLQGGAVRAADARLQLRMSETELLDQRIAFLAARAEIGRLDIVENKMTMKGRIRTNDVKKALPLSFIVNANLQDRSGTFDVSASHKIAHPLLKNELPGWQSDYDLDGGMLDFSLAGKFRDTPAGFEIHGEGQTILTDAVAHYEDMVAAGVAATLPISINKDSWRLGAGTVNIGTVDVGVPLTDVRFDLETDGVELIMSDVSAQVLDGQIKVDSLVYQVEAQTSQFDVAVADVSVGAMLALVSDEVSGRGRLYGTLPVTLSPRGAIVDGGALTARPPGGYLSYGGAVPGSSPGLELAFRALQNFNYDHMNVDVDYVPEGDLDLNVRLQGRSPDVENGRPIHFNLNISQNIPVLLKSLSASDTMSDHIQQRLRQD